MNYNTLTIWYIYRAIEYRIVLFPKTLWNSCEYYSEIKCRFYFISCLPLTKRWNQLPGIEVHSPPLNTWKSSSRSWNQLPIKNKHVAKGEHIFKCATQRRHAEDNSHLRKPFHTILVKIRNVFYARNLYVFACREYKQWVLAELPERKWTTQL